MRTTILILILILSPQGLRADTTIKKIHHHKVVKVAHHIQRSKKMDTTGRYKLVAYYKGGKLKHKYLDTQPTPPQPPEEMDSRVNSLNTD